MTAATYQGIATAEQNYAQAKTQQTIAAALVDDAKAGVARAEEDLKRINNTTASTSAHGAPGHIQTSVVQLQGPAQQRLAAAQARLAAALEMHAKIGVVVEAAADDVQSMGIGFGTWYGNKATAD